ncbi:hypothetical protein EW145_g3378 [Phellinidium pouzarii]|uniref:DUF4211 domain-containing protein n=1 Tax=Phellinidium pouzarii TaxID=167371 RepID=A0A4S4L7A8_9AGAM|nr:hypothetical protein EW145_g3378 [Phellinidium pouzarii]
MPKKTQTHRSRGSPGKYWQQSLLDIFSSSSPPAPKTSLKSAKYGKGKPKYCEQPSTSHDSDVELMSPIRPARDFKKQIIGTGGESDSSDAGRIKFEAQSSSRSDTGGNLESDEVPYPVSSAQSRLAKRSRILESDAEKSDEDWNLESKVVKRQSSKRKQQQVQESGSESELVPEKRKRRLVKGERPSTEEADDVLDGIDEETKKKGQKASESEQEVSEEDNLIPGSRPNWNETSSSESGKNNDDDNEEIDDFIVDDGDQHTANLPAAFSMNTHQDLVHHFKVVCQYFVHLAVTSEAARSKVADRLTKDEYFSIPLTISRRKLADVRDSIASSVWRPDYKKSLQMYPVFNLTDLDFAIPQCDSCHLGGRLSKFVGRLGGTPYDRKTFQELDPESSSNDSDNANDATPPEFNLGRFCAQRTKIFHELCHWEYELFRGLAREVEELSTAGHGFVKVAFAGGITPPDDVSDADQVMDWLDQRGVVNVEWLKVKHSMSRATNLEVDVKRGKEDDF